MSGTYILKLQATKRRVNGELYKVQPDNIKKMRTLLKRQKVKYEEEMVMLGSEPAMKFTF